MKLYVFNGPYFEKHENGGLPAGIAITMPARFFSEYPGGEEQFRFVMDKVNDFPEDLFWHQSISTIPKIDVEFAYLVFNGKVQYRLSILNFERNVSKEFNDGGVKREFPSKNWITLCAPAVKAPSDFFMKGFQGFRYTDLIF